MSEVDMRPNETPDAVTHNRVWEGVKFAVWLLAVLWFLNRWFFHIPLSIPDSLEAPIASARAGDPRAPIPGNGTWLVGEDVQPGTYKSDGARACYWARLSGLSGELDDILANQNVRGQAVVTISATDRAFETDGCGSWARVSARTATPPSVESETHVERGAPALKGGIPGDGVWLVGDEIAAGTYKSDGGGDYCSWTRLSGLTGTQSEVIEHEFVGGRAAITIPDSDVAFETSDCGSWSRLPD